MIYSTCGIQLDVINVIIQDEILSNVGSPPKELKTHDHI